MLKGELVRVWIIMLARPSMDQFPQHIQHKGLIGLNLHHLLYRSLVSRICHSIWTKMVQKSIWIQFQIYLLQGNMCKWHQEQHVEKDRKETLMKDSMRDT